MKRFFITFVFSLFFSSIILISVFAQPPEQITITTYYPSPFGSYRELRTNRLVVHSTRAMPAADGILFWGPGPWGILTPDQGGSIELGGLNNVGGPGIPYIDFHRNNAGGTDFHARIQLDNVDPNRLSIYGVRVGTYDGRLNPGLIPPAVAGVDTGNDGSVRLPGCIKYTFTPTSLTQNCPEGYNVPVAPVRPENPDGTSATSGEFLCCQYQ